MIISRRRKVFLVVIFGMIVVSSFVLRHYVKRVKQVNSDKVSEEKKQDSNRQNNTYNAILDYEQYIQFKECWNRVLTSRFKNVQQTQVNMLEILHTINSICLEPMKNKTCPLPNYLGYVDVNTKFSANLESLSRYHLSFVYHGGWWAPSGCNAKTHSVAIIVPFRNREHHLPVLIKHLHPILRRQQLHYRFFVIKQDKDHVKFNKGQLVNAGIKEILKLYPYECIVIQDVDLLPENDRIDYGCKYSPMHLAALIDKFDYKLPYTNAFGGVVSSSTEHYIKFNGFSNLFWNWGGEDDNMYDRTVLSGLKRKRENLTIARYTMLRHVDRLYKRTHPETKEVYRLLKLAKKHKDDDGYNSVVYRVNFMRVEQLYTSIEFHLVKDSRYSIIGNKET